MKIKTLSIGAMLFAMSLNCGNAQQKLVEKTFETPLADIDSGSWWRKSWEKGYTYVHESEYELTCDAKLKTNETALWITKTALEQLEIGGSMHIDGQAYAISIAAEGSPNPLLLRNYLQVTSTRQIVGRYKATSSIGQKLSDGLFGKGKIKSMAKQVIQALTSFASTLIKAPPGVATAVGVAGNTFSDSVGDSTEAYIHEKLKEHQIEYDGSGFAVKNLDILPQGDNFKLLDGLAAQLEKEFQNASVVIQQTENGPRYRNASLELYDRYGEGEEIHSVIQGLEEPSAPVKAVLQRESLALNEHIFDSGKKNIGDIWVIDGGALSGFLHPDLKGNFRGKLVVKYERDVQRKIETDGKTENYAARQLHLLMRANMNGLTVHSDLSYHEDGFTANIDDNSNIYIYVDREAGYVREATVDFRGVGANRKIPSMKLTQGIEAIGTVMLRVRYRTTRSKLKDE